MSLSSEGTPDLVAFEQLVAEYGDRVFGIALRVTGSPSDAEEVMQDAFLQAFRSWSTFRGEAAPTTWLYRIAVNAALMRVRSPAKRRAAERAGREARTSRTGPQTPRRRSCAASFGSRSKPASRACRRSCASTLILRDVEGLSTAETAAALEITEAAVKSRLHRARVLLARLPGRPLRARTSRRSGGPPRQAAATHPGHRPICSGRLARQIDESFSGFLHLTSQTRAPSRCEWRGSDVESRLATRSVPCGGAAARLAGDRSRSTSTWSSRTRSIARLSHARVYDMLMAGGSRRCRTATRSTRSSPTSCSASSGRSQQLVDYFASAARRLEVRKRILLLMGPVGGGKSTIVTMLKRGLEEYSRDRGRRGLRHRRLPDARGAAAPAPGRASASEVESEHGIYIEGDLCPRCRDDAGRAVRRPDRGRRGPPGRLLGEEARRHRHVLALRSEVAGHHAS